MVLYITVISVQLRLTMGPMSVAAGSNCSLLEEVLPLLCH